MQHLKALSTTLILTVVVLISFFNPILKDPNHIYFAPGGDGLKAYYGALYHVQYDQSALHTKAMNYPYGENIFFTDSQPFVVNSIRFISQNITDISGQTVAIINLLMILSIILGIVFLCLIFTELQTPWWFAAVAAVGIGFLSPQIGRLGGHFTLSYLVWLPLLIWLLMRFDRNKSFFLSALIGFVTFLATGMHMYFFALFGFLFLFYWGYQLMGKKYPLRQYSWMLHVFVQVILPLAAIQLLIGLTDPVGDRTTHPWGFFNYRANPATVFLPLHKEYAPFLGSIKAFQQFDWEAYAFVGLVAFVGTLAGLVRIIKRIRNKQKWYQVSSNPLLNTLFWASVASLLISFSLPFNLGLKFLLDYMGPVQQLRALSRFSWLFFYLINILVFVSLYQIWQKGNKLKWIVVASIMFLLYDAFLNVQLYAPRLENRVAELQDLNNESAENSWIGKIDPSQFQAILPLPYFHVGSENVWIVPKCDMDRHAYVASLKTGLPSMAVMLSRTSLAQTYKSLELISEPVDSYNIFDDLPNEKPLLLMVGNCNELNEKEQRLISFSEKIWEGPSFSLHKLELAPVKQYAQQAREIYDEKMDLIHSGKMDSVNCIVYESFEKIICKDALYGKGAVWGAAKYWRKLFDGELKNVQAGQTCDITFWVKNYTRDLMGRTVFELTQKNGEQITNYQQDQFQHFFHSFRGEWMQIRIPIKVQSEKETLSISVRNTELKAFPLVIDELVVCARK